VVLFVFAERYVIIGMNYLLDILVRIPFELLRKPMFRERSIMLKAAVSLAICSVLASAVASDLLRMDPKQEPNCDCRDLLRQMRRTDR